MKSVSPSTDRSLFFLEPALAGPDKGFELDLHRISEALLRLLRREEGE
jgi:hypothetical protein